MSTHTEFLAAVRTNPINAAILDRGHELGQPAWYLVGGAVFQTVWNHLDGRDPTAGIKDYDLFYFDTDLSYEAEDAVITRAREIFPGVDVEVRNQARVHLWYENKFGKPGRQFSSCEDAIDHFASPVCSYGVRTDADGAVSVYAPFGYDDLYGRIVRPNTALVSREIYEAKAARWAREWPGVSVVGWP
ncbi:nucleotidyltransferase family protein [Actinomycetes bacterium M1A6_2h]